MGKTGTSNPNAGAKEPRITLKNYLDMSKSLSVEPSSSRNERTGGRELKRWDMTRSLNADPGYFTNSKVRSSRAGLDSGLGVSSPAQDLAAPSKGVARSSRVTVVAAKSPLSETSFPSRSSFHTGLNNSKTLPTSPGVSDPEQEKELIEAFVDQLRNIAASSSEPSATTRRVVRKALEFSTHLTAAQRAAGVAEHTQGGIRVVTSASMPPQVDDPRRLSRFRMPNGERVSVRRELLRHHNRLPSVVEEKQTVISSPIVHTSSTTASKTKLKSVDMAPAVQEHAIECAFQLLRSMDKLNCKLLAWQLKKEFDKAYGPAWHCIVGTSFGSYVTHTVGGFIYFAVGKVSILLFRTAIEVVDKK